MNPSIQASFVCGEFAIFNPVEFDGIGVTIEFLGVWTRLNNVSFKPLEFEGFNDFAIRQMQVLTSTSAVKQLKGK